MSLFEPVGLGDVELGHRIVLPPLTRLRANEKGVPSGLDTEYYRQRAQAAGTLLIAGALINDDDEAHSSTPGIYTSDQIKGWKKVTGAVHQQKSLIFLQLWSIGRYSAGKNYGGKAEPVGAPIDELSTADINDVVKDHVRAARNAIAAGFDGVEIHGAHGCLLNRFLYDDNNRDDKYGGSIENKVRVFFDIIDAVSDAIGSSKVGLRLSPFDSNYAYGPIPIFSYLLARLEQKKKEGREIAYVHLVEPRNSIENSDFIRHIWSGALIRAGGFTPKTAAEAVKDDPELLIAFGRYFISNPDLVRRLQDNLPLAKYDRSTLYSQDAKGYTDYPNYDEQVERERLHQPKKSRLQKKLILNAFAMTTPNHLSPGLWRHPSSDTSNYNKVEYWVNLAKLLERGKIHALFIADTLGPYDVYGGPRNIRPAVTTGTQFPVGDPALAVSAMANVTEKLAFGVTTSTTYEHPYTVARRFSTLDHLSNGRVIWNIVTSYLESAAQMYGLETQIDHDERYGKGEEFLEVCYKLWESSWKDDAVIRDKAQGIFADVNKVRPIHHEGKYFKVDGVHINEPSPQRTPLLFQAGTSKRGSEFGTKHSELIFISGFNSARTGQTVADLRKQAEEQGRGADQIKIVVSVALILGETDEEAQQKYNDFLSYADVEGALTLFGGWTGSDLAKFRDDDDFRFEGPPAIQSTVLSIDDSRRWTKADIAKELILGGFSRKIVGSPTTVADELERWATESDLDGFNLAHITSPGSFEDIVNLLVPELQRRGIFHDDYDSTETARGQVFGHDHLPSDHPGYQYKWLD